MTPDYRFVPVVRPGVNAWLVLELYEEEGKRVCGLRYLKGRIRLGPKAFRTALRECLAEIEHEARKAGFDELRHAGDDWSRLLPGWERMTDAPWVKNGLVKRL